MRTMDMLLRTSVFLWISLGLLSVPEKSEAFLSNDTPALCEFVFRNVCLEFVGQTTTWSQARSSCESQGGELLRVMTNPIKVFLSNITRKEKIIDFTWWLGEGVQGDNQEPTKTENGDVSKDFCTYMKLNPLQLKTSDCNQRRGFLCTHILRSPSSSKSIIVPSHATRSRLKRSIGAMAGNVMDIENLLTEADNVLRQMETTVGEPTNNDMKQFIEYLMAGTKAMTKESALQNNDTISHIINCSIAILQVSMENCDMDTNPNDKTLFDNVAEIFQTIAVLMGTSDTQQVTIQHSTGTVYLASRKANEFSNLVLGSESDGAYIKFPDFKELSPQLEKYDTITAQMSAFLNNPHPSDTISGMVCNIVLSSRSANINLSNLKEMIEIFLPHPDAAPLLSNTAVLEQDRKLVTLINITDPQVTVVFTVEHNANVSLLLTLAHGSPPNPQNSRNRTVFRSAGIHHWIITPEMLNLTAGMWYVDTRLNDSKEVSGLTLKISSFMSQCLYWHEVRQTWSTEGCRVGEKTTSQQTQCLCNHLTLFGSSFFVMPNNVDISRTTELFATVNENYVVLALLCAFYGLYLITVLWAAYVDRRARSKRKMTLLEDNHPGAQYNYLIGIQTGHRKSAGTSANVTAQLIGSEGESTRHILTDPDKPVFERGSVDMFLLATPFPLGEVQNLKLQHDNSGDHPSWYINKVTVQDLQTRHVFHFFCNCWLSFDRGDNMTKKTFNAAKNNEIASFRNIFQSRTSTGFRDEHIWVSIVDPPSRSPFTRAQRVSCCMSLLLCTMAINIAFWNLPVDESSPVLFSLGSLQITWQEIIVGVECGLLMFPINILIITIFRSIRPRIISKSTKDNDQENLKPLAVTIPSFLKDTEEVISQIGMCPRNKMPEINSLISTVDLWPAFDHVNELIQRMQGESESTSHWVYSSKFVLAGLCHLHMCLEKLDGKNFNCPEDYQHALNIINVMVRKAEMVFSIHLANCPLPAKKKKKRSVGCLLPWWCVFLGWFLLLSIAGVSTFFTLLYGFEYGREKSIKWVISLGMSLFQSIFILQPLKVIGIAVFFALLLKPVAVEESEEVEQVLSEQRDKCRRYSGKDTL